MKIQVALFAADDIAEPLCINLIESGILACLITRGDKPRGRGRKPKPLSIRKTADKYGIKVLTPESLSKDNFRQTIESIEFDIPIVFGYGLFIPKWIRNWSPYPCVNVHPSLLPRWRGPDPVRATILNGDSYTGVTLHFTEREIDTGEIIMVSEKLSIDINETYDEIRHRLSTKAVEIVSVFLSKLSAIDKISSADNTKHPGKEAIRYHFDCISQNDSDAVYSSKLRKEDVWLDWSKSAIEIHNRIRGLSSNPGARTGSKDKPMKILRSELVSIDTDSEKITKGEIIKIGDNVIISACGGGFIGLTEIQPAAKRIMSARDFVNGYRIKVGDNIAGI